MDDFFDSLHQYLAVLLPPTLMAMAGSLVRFIRLHRSEPFSWGEFLSGMIVAGFVGLVMACFCRGLRLSPWTSSAIIAMAGYSAGQILDYGQELLLKWLERKAK
ncbi:phage holin family protein [Dethiosulfovibrio salsuginis]|uniref:LydA holin phage, holin superfamily III n=1 Tax=Dethiosulfovibrio salsuginis TaxID=561720 RepID=A0A1X7JLQ1_9BACT|nr:phage holin family protein [Dethiosulfovibrio salsuginis]SMG29144.1 LydA holin phage, holin superfamily III [Dethiosulfovibrio salsuginis]